MGTVISFRLDENNPREARALQILQSWASRGYSLRHVLVEALLAYGRDETTPENLSTNLDQIITLLQEMRIQPDPPNNPDAPDIRLSGSFVNAIVKTTRPGLRVD